MADSGFTRLKKRAILKDDVIVSMAELVAVQKAHNGSETHPEVAVAKLKLERAVGELEKSGNDLTGAVEKALGGIGMNRAPGWLFADGVVKPEAE